MISRILSLLIAGGILLSLTLQISCFAADKVVVLPLGGAGGLPKGDQYLTISSAAFSGDSHETRYRKPTSMYHFSSGYVSLIKQVTTDSLLASVNLPDGANVSQISVYIERTGPSDCHMIFAKHALSNHEYREIETIDSAGLVPYQYGFLQAAIANVKIDNLNNQYHLTWACEGLSADLYLYAVRFKYQF